MRRTRDLAGFYLAATLTGLAAAYILNEWFHHIWDARHTPDKPSSSRPSPPPESDPGHSPEQPGPSDQPAVPIPDPDTDTPPSLPPLRLNSLPPSGQARLSGSFYAVHPDPLSSPTPHPSTYEDSVDEEASSHSTTSDTDSFIDLLSPHPPAQVISRRRSFFRNHDLFAESHMSFSQLGSLVAPENGSQSE